MDENAQSAEQIPSTIGRYKIQECVGYGAMGAVYKAFDPLIKRTLAIKTLRLDIPRNAPQYRSFIERFEHEARISGTLNHPNIVTLFDVGEEGGLPFLAMEFVPGETIASLIEKGVRFDPERVISLVSQIAAAVDYAHAKGVIHRDIKPSNLILSEGDNVKVTDFGIAKLADADMTQSGVLLGTPSYMSPEQAMGEKLDGRSDIFSLGVCAFEMLSGEQPFPGNNVTSILYKLVHVDPIEPANLEMSGLIPQKWREVFGKVLAKKPDDRYQRGAEFVHDLEYCLGSWFGAAMGDETVSTSAPSAAALAAAGEARAVGAALATPASDAPEAGAEPATVLLPAATSVAASARRAAARTQPIPVTTTPVPSAEDATVVVRPSAAAAGGRASVTPLPGSNAPSATPVPVDDEKTVVHHPSPHASASNATANYASEASDPEPREDQAATMLMRAAAPAETTAKYRSVASPVEPSEVEASTVLMSAVAPPAATAKYASDAARAEPGQDEASTVLMAAVPQVAGNAEDETDGATVVMPGIAARSAHAAETAAKSTGRGTPRSPRAAPTRPGVSSPKPGLAPSPRARKGPPALLIGVGVLLFGAVAVGVGVFALWRRVTHAPIVAATPSPMPAIAGATPPLVTDGLLRITTRPTGAEITINGEPRGNAPFDGRLPLGLYDVQIALPGYETQARTVDLTAAKPKCDLDLPLERSAPQATAGLADITSTPTGAQVSIDGVGVGVTPLRGVELVPGERHLEISKPGHTATSRTVKAQAGRRVAVDVTLAALAVHPSPRSTPPPVAVDASRVYEAREVDTPPQKLSGEAPDSSGLPHMKRGERISVTVAFVINENGEVVNLEISESQAGERLNQAVLDAVRRWRFAPGVKGGVKVKVRDVRKFTYQAG